ncbi:magnesium/cobalt transporter CorA [soil metagenome]
MIRVLVRGAKTFIEAAAGETFVLPDDAVWVDLLNPTRDEEKACEAVFAINLPTREEMGALETSARLYKEGEATVMTATVMALSDTETPVAAPITFVLVAGKLVTIRYIEPKAFAVFARQLEREPQICASGAAVFTSLLEAIVDRIADVLETAGNEVEALSTSVFGRPAKVDFRPVMKGLGRVQNINAKARSSLVSLARLIGFATLAEPIDREKDLRAHLKSVQRDVVSLTDHSSYLGDNIVFLLDAALGLINVEQNAIIKFFSVAAVVFLPPTLVASYFGMNFHNMPELAWPWGEGFAMLLMAISVLVPLWWFKKRGWL